MANEVEFTVKGTPVAVYSMRDVEVVTVRLLLRAGAWYEKTKKWGAFHLLEHATMDASQKFPQKLDIELFKEEYGIDSNAWTSQTEIGYWFEFPRRSKEEGFELLSQLVFHPVISKENIEKNVAIIVQEHRDKWSNPYARYWKSVKRQIFGGNHPYARTAIGYPSFISTLSADNLQALHRQYFTNKNMVIAVAGKIKPLEVEGLLNKVLPEKTGGKKRISIPEFTSKYKYLWHKEDVKQVGINLTWLTPGKDKATVRERRMFRLGSYLLGGSARSLLFQKLRMEAGLVYSTGASWTWEPTVGLFGTHTSTSPETAKKVLKLMREVVYGFIQKPIPEDTFKRAKNYLDTQALLSYSSSASVANSMSQDLFWEGRIISPEEYIEQTKRISEKNVRQILADSVTTEREFISVISKEDPQLG